MLAKVIPPPKWSSFPASRLMHRRGESEQTPSSSPVMVGNRRSRVQSQSHAGSPSPRSSAKPSSSSSVWSPPPYTPNASNSSQPLSTEFQADGDERYAFLKDFDTIFLVDDSSSMRGERWQEAEAAIAAIAPICTQYDGDGIDIFFLNHRCEVPPGVYDANGGGYTNVTTAAQVQRIFSSVQPRGATPVGKRLLSILGPYLAELERLEHAATNASRRGDVRLAAQLGAKKPKPLNIIAITDGEFTDDAESIIVQVARRLDGEGCKALPWQVGVQFFQIGNDERATKYLQQLDDDLGDWCHRKKMRDIVDTVPWRGGRGERWMRMGC
ncbi:hypothetical protein N7474_004806 [Penicillium riverlandense]|uniref:uncharacterized protein n=1 Tax=Penicillium riverlandense TaxID=1903569 RepID=UPI0025475EB9|nr:uncharacterized protein N7474_004806 [Penicillium riverlandense]KAJ5819215.1 hypothetical protein N7474_004806 [Penicillium riverlandense]